MSKKSQRILASQGAVREYTCIPSLCFGENISDYQLQLAELVCISASISFLRNEMIT
jgi:hypothetical protein